MPRNTPKGYVDSKGKVVGPRRGRPPKKKPKK